MEKQDEDSTETYCIIEPKVEIEDLSNDYKDFIVPKEELSNSDIHSDADYEQTIDIYMPVKTERALNIEMVKFQSEASSENSDSSQIHRVKSRVKFKSITDKKRAEIVALFEQNIAISEIGRRLKISRRTVQLWVHRYADSGHVNRRRPGPPARSYTDASRRHQEIVAMFRKHPLTRITAMAKKYNISTETVRKHLIAAGLRNCKMTEETLLKN